MRLSEKLQTWPRREVWGILPPLDNILGWEESRSIAIPFPSSPGLLAVSMALGAAPGSECLCTGCRGMGTGQDTGWDRSPGQALHHALRVGQAVGRAVL